MAAVLAVGPGAVLSHRSAAAAWGIRPLRAGVPDVSVARAVRRRCTIVVHQAKLPADEMTVQEGIPITTVARTLVDLAAVCRPREVERALEQAGVLRLVGPLSLADLADRYPGRRGIGTINALLESEALGAGITRSELEERFVAFLDATALPRPDLNASIQIGPGRWIEVDCAWADHRVIAELDGHASHGTRAAYEHDRTRDRRLQALGWRTVRITWRQLHAEPDELERDLRALLGLR